MENPGGGSLEHGEAVGYGMLFALDLATERGLDPVDADRVRTLIQRVGLPPLPRGLCFDSVSERLGRDKKAREDGLHWVLPEAIGRGAMFADLPPEAVAERLRGFLAAQGGC